MALIDAVSVPGTWPRMGARLAVPWPGLEGAWVIEKLF